jgi:folate-binding protein YgfZ
MSEALSAVLGDRGIVSVTGEDAVGLLQGILTNDMELLQHRPALFAGLLSPQGKILFDFIVVRSGKDRTLEILLDVAADKAADLVKRLTMYRLRARATIDTRSDLAVEARWGAGAVTAGNSRALAVIADPRAAAMGDRVYAPAAELSATGDQAAYHAHRIALGIPEGGKDYNFADAFPHEANFDLTDGVSFAKGCYVGQEIVARMEHRGTVRKRVVRVTAAAAADLPADHVEVTMGDVVIGRLGSVAGPMGLALLRLDRVVEAIDKGLVITAAGCALTVDPAMIDRQRRLMAEKAVAP